MEILNLYEYKVISKTSKETLFSLWHEERKISIAIAISSHMYPEYIRSCAIFMKRPYILFNSLTCLLKTQKYDKILLKYSGFYGPRIFTICFFRLTAKI